MVMILHMTYLTERSYQCHERGFGFLLDSNMPAAFVPMLLEQRRSRRHIYVMQQKERQITQWFQFRQERSDTVYRATSCTEAYVTESVERVGKTCRQQLCRDSLLGGSVCDV